MFCTSCGVENVADSRYCKHCGTRLAGGTAPASETSTPAERAAALLERSYLARREGDAVEAVGLCREALQFEPDSLPALSLLGQLYEAMGDRELALRTYERLVQLNPSSIADRGKLDDLRGEGRFPVLRSASNSHMLYTGTRPGVNPWQALGFAVAGAALVTLGGFVALRWQDPIRSVSPPSLPAAVTPSNPAGALKIGPEQAPSRSQGEAVTNVPPRLGPPSSQVFIPGVSVGSQQSSYPQRPQNIASVHGPDSAPISRLLNLKRNESTSHRLKLSNEETADDAQGSITIKVDSNKSRETVSRKPSTSIGSARVAVDSNSDGGESAAPLSHDSQSYLAMGDTLKLTGRYDRAIVAYRHALPSGGDQVGYLYQQIGDCFRKRGDKDSALNNYHNAIGEYQKLIDASRNVEYASDGKRVCEKAIKTCSP